jgi:hypothetical protein
VGAEFHARSVPDGPTMVSVASWRCPYCPRSRSSQAVLARHVSRCWANPLAQSCATCANFRPATVLSDPACTVDVDLDSSEPFSALPIGCSKWEGIF